MKQILFLAVLFFPAIVAEVKDEILNDILKELNELKSDKVSCNARINNLEKFVADLKEEVGQLRTTQKQHAQEGAHSGSSSASGEGMSSSLGMLPAIHRNKRTCVRLLTDVKSIEKQVSSGPVAFTAGIGTFDLTNLGDHHTIAFDKTITNIGNAYSPNTGIFTAPFKGAYAFTLTLMVNGRHKEYLEIVKDGTEINDILADATSDDDYVSSTKQWILELDRNSQVWVRTTNYYNQGEIHGNMHTVFNGFLLFQLE